MSKDLFDKDQRS